MLFLEYLNIEIFGVSDQSKPYVKINDVPINNVLAVAPELEKFLLFGFLVAFDAFLYLFTYFPIRLTLAVLSVHHEILKYFSESYFRISILEMSKVRAFDLLRGLMFVISFSIIYQFNLSTVYHLIRYQNTIKLYVLVSMIEVIDKLLSSFGQDVFDSLHYHLLNKRIPVFQVVVATVYAVAHSILYFLQVATLTVVVNSADDALLTVLIVNNFTELKGYVFKKYDRNNLFQLSCADIVEQFQTLIFLSLVFLVTLTQNGFNWIEQGRSFLRVTAMIIAGETIADCAKHCFICKFNSIHPSVYQDYHYVLQKDLLTCGSDAVIIDHTFKITRRIGLCQVFY